MKPLLVVLLLLTGCAEGNLGLEICSSTQSLAAKSSTLWSRDIVVCWDESFSEEYVETKTDVEAYIDDSWNKALAANAVPESEWIQIVGWLDCTELDEYDIRIILYGGINYSDGLGTRSSTLHFNDIEFSYPNRRSRFVAVHEFGHTLGIGHEHNRNDTPEECEATPNGTNPDRYYGAWDSKSVMNYCRDNEGLEYEELSPGDIYWIKRAYYPSYYIDLDCTATL